MKKRIALAFVGCDDPCAAVGTGVKGLREERKRMSAATNLIEMVASLSEVDAEKVYDFAAFLKFLEQKEDEEDRQAILERMDEPTIPFEDVKKELGLV